MRNVASHTFSPSLTLKVAPSFHPFGLAIGLIRIIYPLGIPSLGMEPVNGSSGRTEDAEEGDLEISGT